jgi:hypothetical protein
MAAATLNSSRAVEMSIHVVRAFVRLRGFFISNKALAEKFDELERKVGSHEEAIAGILRALRELMTPRHCRSVKAEKCSIGVLNSA